jgi:hypothetical protein
MYLTRQAFSRTATAYFHFRVERKGKIRESNHILVAPLPYGANIWSPTTWARSAC